MSGSVRTPDARFAPPARPVGGIDWAKHARLRADADLKRAGMNGALQLLRELREDRDAEAQAVHLGMNAVGRQLWTSNDMADLLTWSAHDQADGRVDVAAVRRCLALKDRCKCVQEQVDMLNAELAPLTALIAACDKYVQLQQGL
ncbi:hypothetical protein [Rhizobacter fulvus]